VDKLRLFITAKCFLRAVEAGDERRRERYFRLWRRFKPEHLLGEIWDVLTQTRARSCEFCIPPSWLDIHRSVPPDWSLGGAVPANCTMAKNWLAHVQFTAGTLYSPITGRPACICWRRSRRRA